METDVKDGAASSTAVAEPEEILDLKSMSEAQRVEFLEKGTIPTRQPKTEETKSDDGKEKPVESGAASDAAGKDTKDLETKDDEPKPRESRAERRIRKLNDELKQLRAELAAKPETKPPVTSVATKPADANAPKRPRLKDFTDRIGAKEGYTDWDAAHEAYEEATDLFHVEREKTAVLDALKEQQAKLDSQKQADLQKKETNKNANAFANKAAEFRKSLKEDNFAPLFVEVKEAIDDTMKERPEMAAISDALVESEVGPELVYYLGQNDKILDDLLAMPLRKALIELGKLESSDKIKAPAPRTVTAAKKSASSVSGAHANSEDALEKAVEKNDMGAFLKEHNKRATAEEPKWGW
jgi:hypothetical protein